MGFFEWLVLIGGGCLLVFCLWTFYCGWHFRQLLKVPFRLLDDPPLVSVIVPARNEGENLSACLNAILDQDYPASQLEVIVVDDHSTDQTPVIAAGFGERVRLIRLQDQKVVGKKAALENAIEQARGEFILQVDADCRMGPNWCRSVISFFNAHTGLVAAPVILIPGSKWHEYLQALELCGLVAMSAGAIKGGLPVMSNGANLAFRKQTFIDCGGYYGVDSFASGDDELLMQKVMLHPKWEVAFAANAEAIVSSRTISHPGSLWRQRLRWVGKSRHYLIRRINLIQAIAYLGFWSFPLSFFGAFFYPWIGIFLGVLVGVKLLADLFLMIPALRFFSNLPWLKWLPVLELVYVPYVLLVGLIGNLQKQIIWKGRTSK